MCIDPRESAQVKPLKRMLQRRRFVFTAPPAGHMLTQRDRPQRPYRGPDWIGKHLAKRCRSSEGRHAIHLQQPANSVGIR